MVLMPKSSAVQAIRRCSLTPPTLVTSGWTMSNAPRDSHGRKACRRVSTSPPAIGTWLRRRRWQWSSRASGRNEQLRVGADPLARGPHDRLVQTRVERAAERAPADLEGREAALPVLGHDVPHPRGLLHQE